MSYKIRRSRGGWQVWRVGQTFETRLRPSIDGSHRSHKIYITYKKSCNVICKGLTRGEARNVGKLIYAVESEIRERVFNTIINFKPWEVPVADNNRTLDSTVSDVLSRCPELRQVQSEGIHD